MTETKKRPPAIGASDWHHLFKEPKRWTDEDDESYQYRLTRWEPRKNVEVAVRYLERDFVTDQAYELQRIGAEEKARVEDLRSIERCRLDLDDEAIEALPLLGSPEAQGAKLIKPRCFDPTFVSQQFQKDQQRWATETLTGTDRFDGALDGLRGFRFRTIDVVTIEDVVELRGVLEVLRWNLAAAHMCLAKQHPEEAQLLA